MDYLHRLRQLDQMRLERNILKDRTNPLEADSEADFF